MKGPARLLFASAVLVSSATTSWSQLDMRPTPAPVVTAENEAWYRAGEPLVFAGSLYHPAGAAIHFLPNEMVRSGFYQGVPLYSRTTIAPFTVIFVPVGGGLMQPYERRRDLDLSPSFATLSPAIAQAPAPPVVGAPAIVDEAVAPGAAATQPTEAAPQTVATTGIAARSSARRPMLVRRGAANAIYVEFNNARWFSAGPPVSLDVRTLTRLGESHGFPVYAARPGASTIYIPIAEGVDSLAPYTKRR